MADFNDAMSVAELDGITLRSWRFERNGAQQVSIGPWGAKEFNFAMSRSTKTTKRLSSSAREWGATKVSSMDQKKSSPKRRFLDSLGHKRTERTETSNIH